MYSYNSESFRVTLVLYENEFKILDDFASDHNITIINENYNPVVKALIQSYPNLKASHRSDNNAKLDEILMAIRAIEKKNETTKTTAIKIDNLLTKEIQDKMKRLYSEFSEVSHGNFQLKGYNDTTKQSYLQEGMNLLHLLIEELLKLSKSTKSNQKIEKEDIQNPFSIHSSHQSNRL